jgi:hypothetical protein
MYIYEQKVGFIEKEICCEDVTGVSCHVEMSLNGELRI